MTTWILMIMKYVATRCVVFIPAATGQLLILYYSSIRMASGGLHPSLGWWLHPPSQFCPCGPALITTATFSWVSCTSAALEWPCASKGSNLQSGLHMGGGTCQGHYTSVLLLSCDLPEMLCCVSALHTTLDTVCNLNWENKTYKTKPKKLVRRR
jgi:hypothetical protein